MKKGSIPGGMTRGTMPYRSSIHRAVVTLADVTIAARRTDDRNADARNTSLAVCLAGRRMDVRPSR